MKFKKIASVLASTAMVFSTLGFAAATMYPEPFVENGSPDVAIVYGAGTGQTMDLAAVVDITTSLDSYVVEGSIGSTPVDADCEGETCINLGRSNDHINLGDYTWPEGTSVNEEDLTVTLADGEYVADDNGRFEYEQSIALGNATFTYSQSSRYEEDMGYDEKTPFLGYTFKNGDAILNYTLDFVQDAESTVTDGDLDDFEGSTIMLFGREYFISDAKNGTNANYFGKVTLLDAANSAIVGEGEIENLVIGGETYTVSAVIFSGTNARLEINGEQTNSLNVGETWELSDGTKVSIKSIDFSTIETGPRQVEFTIGSGEIEITPGEEIKVDDKAVRGLYGYFKRGAASSTDQKLDKVIIEWKSYDDSFLTLENSLQLPGLGGLELDFESWVRPAEEEIFVENFGGTGTTTGEAGIKLRAPIAGGDAEIELLYTNATGEIKGIGQSTTRRLATSATSALTFYDRKGDADFHEHMVVSYNTTKDAHSYLIRFDVVEEDGYNKTNVVNAITGDTIKEDQKAADVVDSGIGDASFTISSVGKNATDRWVVLSAGTNTNFNTLYTENGMKIWLPVEGNGTSATGRGDIDFDDGQEYTDAGAGHNSGSWYLYMEGRDKDDNIAGGGYIQLTIDANADKKLEAYAVGGEDLTSRQETGDSTKIYEYYSKDETAARIWYDTDDNPNQLTVFNPAGESYAEVFLKASDAALGGGSDGTVGPAILDTEVSQASGKNLIVVGGSCVNEEAARLLGRTEKFCGEQWTAATGVGAGEFLIQTFSRDGGNVATLVAGWTQGDTQNAATALTTQDNVDTTAGTKYTGQTADSITLAVS